MFDANIGVGHRHDRPAPFQDADGLIKVMHQHGVDKAVIYHVQGESISAIEGNLALSGWAGIEGPFSLQWTAGPDEDSLRQLQAFNQAGQVKSVRLHDTESSRELPFVDWIYGDLLSWLCKEKIPLWISLANTSPVEMMATLRQFPELVTIILGAHYTHAHLVRPLMKHLPLAHLELSRYEVLGGVEALKKEFGVQRLIYGSFYPRYEMGPILYYLHKIRFKEEELAAICGDNLERVLGNGGKGD